ncbi:hypothetical protein N7456_001078 [Penicillium angulare]|uniref:Nucleoside phosphorylase domain-containing protein n=1 Tax=Penicillium angulare TaxID=116970 RepID=A0A9W9GDN3_9EURO|nr:hypothetical protein N7456_001078 [Penicillium angulare]
MPLKKLSRDAYRVGWICPLEVEQVAAMEMLDEDHELLPQPSADTNIYNLGSINGHNVVIAGLPRTGSCSAATVVSQMKMTFPNLKYVLLVGIGGGVPVSTDQGMIRLGHVVVSQSTGIHSGAIQYDRGKAKSGHFERTGSLAPPPTALLNAAREVAVHRQRMEHDPIERNIQRIKTSRRTLKHFEFPGTAKDHLYRSNYEHQQKGVSCEDGACDSEQRIKRSADGDASFVVVHRGTIASGELVIRDANKRDNLAQEYEVLCFEMEAAGALADFPCLVIRGISDYCDSHKSDIWHGYAAAAAAAYARQLFFHMAIEETQGILNKPPSTFELPLKVSEINEVLKFVSREDELGKLQEVLVGSSSRRTAVIHGLGGMGKTQLAIAFMKRHHSNYSARIWMNAKDETTLKQSFALTAEWILRYHPSTKYIAGAVQSQNLDATVKAVKRWLDEPMNSCWLLVYDNYDNPLLGRQERKDPDPDPGACIEAGTYDDERLASPTGAFDLRLFLPDADHGSIIVTTRSSMVRFGKPIPLCKLKDINESLEILVSASGRTDLEDDPAAHELATKLDGLPLALATAGGYLNQVSVTCTEYLELYRDSWRQLQEETPQLPTYDQTLYSTWNISYKHIQDQDPNAAMLLRQWAYFSNQDIWYELLLKVNDESGLPKWLENLTRDKLKFDTALRLLCSHGLVEADLSNSQLSGSQGYSVHGCVHSWMIYILNAEVDKQMVLTAVRCAAACLWNLGDNIQAWSLYRRVIAHADRSVEVMRYIDLVEIEEPWIWNDLSSLYAFNGRFREGEMMLENAVKYGELTHQQEREDTQDAMHGLATTYASQGRDHSAETMFNRVIKSREKTHGQDSPLTLESVVCLANLYTDQGRLQEAEALSTRVLKVCEDVLQNEHDIILYATESLARVYKYQRRFHEAETMFNRGLETREKRYGRDDLSTLSCVDDLADLYKRQGRYKEAEIMFKRVLGALEMSVGREHPFSLYTVMDLGNLYSAQHRFQEAETMYDIALKEHEEIYGDDFHDFERFTLFLYIGLLRKRQNRFEEAERMYQRALEGFENIDEREEQEEQEGTMTLRAVFDLGVLYLDQSRFEEAETMFTRALVGYEKSLGPISDSNYPRGLSALMKLGICLEDQGKDDDALLCYRRALDGTGTVWGRDSKRYTALSDSIKRLEDELFDVPESKRGKFRKKMRSKISHFFKSQ